MESVKETGLSDHYKIAICFLDHILKAPEKMTAGIEN